MSSPSRAALTGLGRYPAVIREAGVGPALAASLVGRLSLGMSGFAILLLVRQSSGSYAVAGAVSAAYALAFAVGVPTQARRADRLGPVPVLVRCALVQPVALTALALMADRQVSATLLVVPAVVGGLFVPPLSPVMRALWAARLDAAALPTAYSLESVLVELCFVVGPVLVAGLSTAIGPSAAVVASGLLTFTGGIGMATRRGLRAVSPEEDVTRHRAGPLTSPAVRALLLTVLCIGVSFGAIEVAMPAFAERTGSRPAAAGLLLAVWSVGSILGGLGYGNRPTMTPVTVQMRFLVVALAAGSALPLLAPTPVAMGLALLLYGVTIAPFMACNSVLLGSFAPRGTTTEAFAWSSSMIFGGYAIGGAAGGIMAELAGSSAALAVAAVGGAVTLAVSLTGRRHLLTPVA